MVDLKYLNETNSDLCVIEGVQNGMNMLKKIMLHNRKKRESEKEKEEMEFLYEFFCKIFKL